MVLKKAIRRQKAWSLFLMTLALALFGLSMHYSYQLHETNEYILQLTEKHAVTLGSRELRRTELDKADKDFLKSQADRAEQDLNTAEDYYLLGIQAFSNNKYEEAAQHFTQAINLQPDWVEAYLARGRNASMQGSYKRAIQDFSKGLELSKKFKLDAEPEFYAARCFAHMKSSKLEEALTDCNQAIEAGTENYWVPFNYRGFVYYLLHKDNKAVTDWKRAADYRSTPALKAKSLENLGLVYLRANDWQRALDNANHVEKLCSECAWNCLIRGISADKLGNKTIAEKALNCWRKHKDSDDSRHMRDFLPASLHSYLGSETSDRP